MDNIEDAQAHDVTQVKPVNDGNIAEAVVPFPVKGIEPALYDTNYVTDDVTRAVGAPEAAFGNAQGSATSQTIAETTRQTDLGSSVDQLDETLSDIARDGSQVLFDIVTPEQAMMITGPGGAWPTSPEDVDNINMWLEVVAGSSGRPNRAVDLANWERASNLLVQLPGLNGEKVVAEILKVIDDKIDITALTAPGLPSIVAQNAIASSTQTAATQPSTGDPATDPAQQSNRGQGAPNVEDNEVSPPQDLPVSVQDSQGT